MLHFHLDYWPFSLFARQRTPFLTTLHGRLDLPELWPMYRSFPDARLVSISDAQRKPMPFSNWVGTVHHGLPLDLLMPLPARQDYLAFVGRIAPEKRVDRAIEIAARAGMKIKIAAKIDRVDRDYFEQEIRPLFAQPHVEYVGEIADHQKSEFLSGAHALLLPIDWPEPFGLVMIEAMACGTPVIAFPAGSVPEVVEHGRTGFLVPDVAAAAKAVEQLPELSRTAVRRRFEERFSARRMAEDYVALYAQAAREAEPELAVAAE